jgi:hypothetical protein
LALSGGGGGGGSARGIEAGRAFVRLGGKDDLSAMLKGLVGKFNSFGATVLKLTGIGGLVGGLLGGMSFKETADDLSKMNDVAKAFGITGRQASGLFGALQAAGGEFKENLEGIIQFSTTVQEAVDGVGTQGAKLFDGLKVSAKEVVDLPIDEKFMAVHEAIRELPQAAQETKLALLGGTDSMKQWQRLLAMSNEEFRQLAKDMQIGTKELEDAAQASREMQKAGAAIQRVWQQVVIMLAPSVTQLAKAAVDAMKPVVEWMKGRTLQDVWDEVVALAGVAWTEVSIFARDVWAEVWDFFRGGWDAAVKFARDLFADLAVGVSGMLVDAFKGALNFLAGGVNKVAGVVAVADAGLANKMRAGAAAARVGLGQMADDAKGGAKAVADAVKAGAKAEFDANARLRAAEKAAREAKNAEDRQAAQAELDRVRAEIALRRAVRMEEEKEAEKVGQKMAGQIGKALGTFGVGSFLQQGYGVQSADKGKQMVDEQRKGNRLLAKLVDKAGPLVIT